MKNFLLVLAVLFSRIVFAGNITEIKGVVLDQKYFPVPKVTVYTNSGASTKTDKDGKFKLYVDKTPYDLYVMDYAVSTGVVYRNLTTSDPEIMLFGYTSSKYANTEVLKVEFPSVPSGRTAILKFISDDIFYSNDVIASPGETSKILTIDFPSSKDRINGRIIYLEKTSQKFERFSERAVTIIKNYYPQTIIVDLTTYTQPGDSYLTVYMPTQDFDRKSFSIFADFLSMHRNAEMLLNSTEGDIVSTKVLVPQNLPFGYRIKINGSCIIKNNYGFENYFYSYPGSNENINTETPPMLDAPQDKFWGVNNNTKFSYDWGSGTGIYIAHFHCFDPVADFYVVTTDRNIPSPLSYAKSILTGVEYSWSVSKYTTYLSVDDFVKVKNFSNDLGYRAILNSELRTFRTKL